MGELTRTASATVVLLGRALLPPLIFLLLVQAPPVLDPFSEGST